MPDAPLPIHFLFFNEIGILNQLARARMEARLPDGLIQPHFTVINHLIRVKDGRTPLELARAFEVPKTTMTHTLAGLEKHGLVNMRPNPSDGRSKCVFLTDKGRAFRDETVRQMRADFASLTEHFDSARIAAVLPLLTDIRKFMDENRQS